VVSVDLKKSYVLSALDYSSKIAVKLVDTKTVRFKGTIDEVDIMKVKPGQKASLTIDAIPNKKFTGTVRFISPYGTAVGKVIKFSVLVDIDPSEEPIRGGLSATAEIQVAGVKNALLVPATAVIRAPGGPVVLVPTDDPAKPERRKVKVGISNFKLAEVTEGLKDEDKVQMPTAKDLASIPANTGQGAMRSLR
jgi:HlyD family secretion protein